jgi:hypothetical protein
MGARADFPNTSSEVLAVITAAERSRKYVWTAGRVLIETALVGNWKELDHKQRKVVLRHITKLLNGLVAKGSLVRRPDLQSIGFGREKAFDFILVSLDAN